MRYHSAHVNYLMKAICNEMNEKNRTRRISDRRGGGCSIIWHDSVIRGAVSGADDYIVYGKVEGDAHSDGALMLQPGAIWQGNISANDVVIAGTVHGDVVARGKLELAGTARVRGNITGKAVAIAAGAVFEGEMRMAADAQLSYFQDRRTTKS